MKIRFNPLWIFVLTILLFLVGYFTLPTFSTITSSPSGTFNETPETVYLNWTNNYTTNITFGVLGVSLSNFTFTVINSIPLVGNYSQSNSLSACTNIGYNLLVQNNTNSTYFNASTPFAIRSSQMISINLTDPSSHLSCAPGRYWNNSFLINATNLTTSNESVSITVVTDIPISSSNNANLATTGVGTFGGSLPAYAGTYQSYFFNTNTVPNATSITVNLTGWSSSQYVNMFLFDDTKVQLAKSINMNTSQVMSYNYLPSTPKMWEIRIYGNSTAVIPYTGYIIYSTLNVTNSSIGSSATTIASLNFGNLTTSSNVSSNFTITNQGGLNEPNVVLSSVIFRSQQFTGSGTRNFTFLVGDNTFESKIRAGLWWTGSSNYTLYLYNSSGTLMNTSSNYYTIANVSNASAVELFNETTVITPGYWTAAVVSNSGSDTYNLNVSIYQSQKWIVTNYTTTSFNGFKTNATVQMNLAAPNNTIDGVYQGSLLLTDGNTGIISIPISFNITTPTLLIFNVTASPTAPLNLFNNGTIRVDEDYGVNLTKIININLTNVGSLNQSINMTLNSSVLTCTNCAPGFTVNFTYNTTNNIANKSSQLIQINISFYNSAPVGIYDGWIFINANNNTMALSSHPYPSYNLTVRLNLTNLLSLTPLVTTSLVGNNISSPQGINETDTVQFTLAYVNGTPLEIPANISASNTTNFTVFLQEGNVTNIFGNLTNLLVSNGKNPLNSSNLYVVNFSVPANALGGLYTVNPAVNYVRGDGTVFYGVSGIGPLQINNLGMFMSTNVTGTPNCQFGISPCSSAVSVAAGGTLPVYVNVTNYGGLSNSSLSEVVNFSYTTCTAYSVAATSSGSSCSGGSTITVGTTQWTIGTMNSMSSCLLVWTITAVTNASSACPGLLTVKRPSIWFDPSGVNLSISVTGSVATPSSPASSSNAPANLPPPGGTTPAAQYLQFTSYPSIFPVEQGQSNTTTVTVKNINGTKTQNISLSIATTNNSWATVSPSIQTLILPLTSASFTATFNVPSNAEVKDHDSQFIASSDLANVSQSFKLRVLPSAATKVVINDTLQLLVLNFTKLSQEINQSKGVGLNTTDAEATFALLTLKINDAKNAIASGDYFTAAVAETQIKSLMNQAYAALSAAKVTNPFAFLSSLNIRGYVTYIIIAAGVAGGLILAYLFWPTKIKPALQDRFGSQASTSVKKEKETYEDIEKKMPVSEKYSDEENVWDRLREKWEDFSKKKR